MLKLLRSLLVAALAFAAFPVALEAAPTPAQALSQVARPFLPTTQETNAGLVQGTSVGTICNLGYLPGNWLRYCADPSGNSDSTPAFNAALAQRKQHGEPIVVPAGIYKGNFVVTGQYIDIRVEHFAYEDPGTVYGLIANSTSLPIFQLGDSYAISGITLGTSTIIQTSDARASNPVRVGDTVYFQSIVGTTQLNGTSGTVTQLGGTSGAWTFTVNINSSAYTAWSSGGVAAPITTSVRISGGLQIHGQGTAQKCTNVAGAANVWIDGIVSRGCTLYAFNYTASAARNSSYVFVNDYRFDIPAGASSAIGVACTEPSNYPTSYATALYLTHGALQGSTTAGSWGSQINQNCTIDVAQSYWTMGDGTGMDFPDAGGTGVIQWSNSFVDTLSTNAAVLATAADNNPIEQHLVGTVTLNGKVSINGTTSTAAVGGYGFAGNRTFLLNPSITGVLDFQSTAAAKANQTVYANQLANMTWNGSNLFITNGGSGSGGAIILGGTSATLTNYGATADAPLVFGITGIKVMTGAGAPSSTQPLGTLYLRSDGNSTTTRLYISLGGGTWANFTSSS